MFRAFLKVVTGFLIEDGYGQKMALGAGRFRSKRPDWIFIHHPMSHLKKFFPDEYIGGIGHFYSEAHFEFLKKMNVPYLVSVSSRAEPEKCLRVIPDNFAVGQMAADYFLKKQYQNFRYVSLNISFAQERIEGFLSRLHENGISDVSRLDVSSARGIHLTSKKIPIAVFVPTDRLAVNLINHILSIGLRIPEDVAVLGVDNNEICSIFSPIPLSSVALPFEEIGFIACEELEHMVEKGEQSYGSKILQPLNIVERRSTETISAKDGRVRKAQAHIRENLRELEGVSQLAQLMHTNRRTLDRLFLRNLGLTAADWILRCRTEFAERLILETDYTVDHVADLSGFGDRRRLYRAFKCGGRPLPSVLRGMK